MKEAVSQKLRDDMFQLLGKMDAIRFPILWNSDENVSRSYYDLVDTIRAEYVKVLEELFEYKDE